MSRRRRPHWSCYVCASTEDPRFHDCSGSTEPADVASDDAASDDPSSSHAADRIDDEFPAGTQSSDP